MVDEPLGRSRDDGGGAGSYPGAPRWVKVSAIVLTVLILLVVVLHLTGNQPIGHVLP